MSSLIFNCFRFRDLVILLAIIFLNSCKKEEEHLGHNDTPAPVLEAAVYVANEDDGTISVVDPLNFKNVYTIHLSEDMTKMLMPHNVQAAPDGKTIWVTCVPETEGETEQVVIIDALTNKIIRRINVGNEQHLAHVVLDDESKFAYVTCNESGQVIQIDASSYTEVNRYNLEATDKPHGLRHKSGHLYVANMNSKSMLDIDLSNGGMTDYYPLGGVCVQTAVTPDGNYAFASLYDTKEVARFGTQSKAIEKLSLPAESQGPIQLYPTPDGKYLYVCDQGVLLDRPSSNKVYVIDITTFSIEKSITVGNKAHGIVVSNDGKYAFVTNSLDNTVSVIEVSSQSVIKTIAVGKAPNGISYWYKTGGMP